MVSDNISLTRSIMSLPAPAGIQGTDQPPPPNPSCGCGCGRGRGGAGAGAPAQFKIQWDTTKDPNIHARTAHLLTWCNTYPDARLKLFSDSSQDAANEGRSRQQMSAHKEYYLQQAAGAVFKTDHDPKIRQLFDQDPSKFVNPVKSHFQS